MQDFADAIFLRTYCRTNWETGVTETRQQVYNRCLDAWYEQLQKIGSLEKLYLDWPPIRAKWYCLMKYGKAMPAGRMLWALGSRTVQEEGFLPLVNCAFVKIDHPVEPFLFIAKMLFMGCGCGFSVRACDIEQANEKLVQSKAQLEPYISERTGDPNVYHVEDSRHGYIDFIKQCIINGLICRKPFIYSIEKLRPANSPIKGFGGRSGDPRKLGEIGERIYWMGANARFSITSTLAVDIACSIGELVVSGNVRRSALIALGDADDKDYLDIKRFSNMADKPWRSYSNNSVYASKPSDLGDDYWATYDGHGEAYGWVDIEKCRRRDMKDGGPDRYLPEGFNPCGEQPLANHEVCNLGEVNLCAIDTYDELQEAVMMCYHFCKMAYTYGAPTEPETERICQANQRIGISFSGYAIVGDQKRKWISQIRKFLHEQDQLLAGQLYNAPTSIALTTMKPGGTLAKVMGCPVNGIHLPISKYYLRRVTFKKDSPLLETLSKRGIVVEHQKSATGQILYNESRMACFPICVKEDCLTSGEITQGVLLERYLELLAECQDLCIDNSISVTVYYQDPEELRALITGPLFERFKCFSGLKYFGHNFAQPMEEPITAEEYEALSEGMRDLPPLTLTVPDPEEPENFESCPRGGCSDK